MRPRPPALRLPLMALLLVGCAHRGLTPERCATPWAPQMLQPETDALPLHRGEGSIHGLVKNRGGEPIPDARVVLTQVDGEGRSDTVTDERGYYAFHDLPAADLNVTVIVGLNDVNKTVNLPEGAKFRANFVHSTQSGRQVLTPGPLPEDALLRIQKSACMGSCPSFTVTVFRDGRWLWESSVYTRVEEDRSGHLRPRQLDRIHGIQRCLVAVPNYDWGRQIDRSTITLLFRDGADVIQLHSHNEERTPPQVRAAVKAIGETLPIRRFVGRSWRL